MRAWKNAWWQTRLERLEQAAQAKDSARMFGEAQQMSRLLRSNGLSSSPIFENPAAATQDRAQHSVLCSMSLGLLLLKCG